MTNPISTRLVVIVNCHWQEYNHMQQPQVHFVKKAIESGYIARTDFLQGFVPRNKSLTPTRLSNPKAKKVGRVGIELSGLPG